MTISIPHSFASVCSGVAGVCRLVSRISYFDSIRLARDLFHFQWHISAMCDNRGRADWGVLSQSFGLRSDGHQGGSGYIIPFVIDVTSLRSLTEPALEKASEGITSEA
jgi:hypothetical protein